MIKLIIYDLDGTLIDSSKDISNSLNWALKELGFSEVSELLIRSHVGSGILPLIQNVLKEASPDHQIPQDGILERAISLYRSYYSDHLLDETKLYPGVKTVLDFFKEKKQAVITNKSIEFPRRILKGLGIDHYFFEVIGEDQKLPKKPAPDSVLKLLRFTKTNRNEAILIGDSMIDIQTAKNAKIKVIAVTYGFDSKAQIEACQPDWMINQLDELMEMSF